jgi:hypothetical protein
VTARNTFEWTPIVSTNGMIPSSQRLSTLSFAGTKMRLNATAYLSDVWATKRKAFDQFSEYT